MSQENVEIVRALNRRFNAGDESWVELYAEEVEFVMPPEWPEDQVYRGRAALVRINAAVRAPFDGNEWDLDRVIDLGDDRVVSLLRLHGRIDGSGQVEQRFAIVQWLSERKIVRQVAYFSWDEALKAVELAE